MESIQHLPKRERVHFMQCPDCKHWFDMRDLNAVFSHEHYLQRVPVFPYSYSSKVGEPILYFKNHSPIIIN